MSARPIADAVVVAAGSSTRMDGIDKLAHQVAGRPLLAWSIDALAAAEVVDRIVVVTAPDRIGAIRGGDWLDERVVAVVAGGERRHESVAAGLAALDGGGERAGDPVVLVHDGARPMPSPGLVSAVALAAAAHGAAIPVVPVTDTLKRLDGDVVVETVDRSGLGAAQTPQGARASILRSAFERFPPEGPEAWTDEAALLEACRIPVHALPGEPANLKVTVPADLARVELAISGRAGGGGGVVAERVGTGLDSHPFGPGGPLVLGGVEIPGAPRLHGHSDGDVALHAVADALLGAAGAGDLGRLFPPTAATPRGIASGELLAAVVARLAGERLAARRVDLTVVGARPRLAPYLDAMRDAIAGRLGIDASAVSVKASTGNLGGDEGAGRSMSALAIAVVGPIP